MKRKAGVKYSRQQFLPKEGAISSTGRLSGSGIFGVPAGTFAAILEVPRKNERTRACWAGKCILLAVHKILQFMRRGSSLTSKFSGHIIITCVFQVLFLGRCSDSAIPVGRNSSPAEAISPAAVTRHFQPHTIDPRGRECEVESSWNCSYK